jgi:hypothetical protein
MNNFYWKSDVVSLMPAPGWRVHGCGVHNDEIFYFEMPVVGWAVVNRTCFNSKTDQPNGSRETSIDLMVLDEQSVRGFFNDVIDEGSNTALQAFSPTEEFTEEAKANLLKQAYSNIKRRAEAVIARRKERAA